MRSKIIFPALIFFVSFFFGCFKEVTKVSTIYQNDFEDVDLKSIVASGFTNGTFGPFNNINIVDFNGTKVLGRFNNGKIDLHLHKLPTHQAITVKFDLYIHDKWNNDLWKMVWDGNEKLVTGFSNFDATPQSYPNWIGNGSLLNPAGANSYNRNLPGACILASSSMGTSLYKMEQTYIHSDTSFSFSCSDAGNYFNLNCERSWSIDNLKITLINNQ
jgi:hypothetical protein